MTAADALVRFDRRIADTVFKFGVGCYPTFTLKEAQEISAAWHAHLTMLNPVPVPTTERKA